MRILHVNRWLPAPPMDGGKLRKLQHLAVLHAEHTVCVVGQAMREGDTEWLRGAFPGLEVIGAQDGDGRAVTGALLAMIAARPMDLLLVSGIPQWPLRRRVHGPRVVLDVDSLESRVLETLRDAGAGEITALDVDAVRALERHAFTTADAVLVCSTADAERVARLAPGRPVHVVPNTVDVASFDGGPAPLRTTPPVILFSGFLAYRPNADACLHFVAHVLPRIRRRVDVVLRIVGRLPPVEVVDLAAEQGVEVHADVPDIRPWLSSAHVVVAPVRAGSGTRLKILEAFAARRPVVSTTLGCEGLDVRDGEHLLVADHPSSMADAVTRLLGDPSLAVRLGAAGRALVERRYDRRVVEACLRRAIVNTVAGSPTAAGGGAIR